MEAIWAIGLFVLVSSPIILMMISGHNNNLLSQEKMQAIALAQQGYEASRSIRDNDWANLTTGTHGLTDASGYWAFSGSSETIGNFTRVIEVTTLSTDVREVEVTVTWDAKGAISDSVVITGVLTDWINVPPPISGPEA